PIARKKTPILIRRVNKPRMINKPTIASTIVNTIIAVCKASGLETKYSIIGLIPKALGKKWLNFSPIYPASSGISLFSKIKRRQNAEKYVQPITQRNDNVNRPALLAVSSINVFFIN